jgi:hypothetical protein
MIVDRRFRGAYCLHHQGIPEDNSEHHTQTLVAQSVVRHYADWATLLLKELKSTVVKGCESFDFLE